MTWYNSYVTKDSYDKFNNKNDCKKGSDLVHFSAIQKEENIFNEGKSANLQSRLNLTWRLISAILEDEKFFVYRSHLESLGKNKTTPSDRVCFYIKFTEIKDKEDDKDKIINFSVKDGDISIQFRKPAKARIKFDDFLKHVKLFKPIEKDKEPLRISVKNFVKNDSENWTKEITDDEFNYLVKILHYYICNIRNNF